MLDKRNYIQQQFQCFNFQMDCSSNVKIILKKKRLTPFVFSRSVSWKTITEMAIEYGMVAVTATCVMLYRKFNSDKG